MINLNKEISKIKSTLIHGVLTLLNIGLVFLFYWLLITYFGFNASTDAYFAGSIVPLLISQVVVTSLPSVLVPKLTLMVKRQQKKTTWIILIIMVVAFTFIGAILSFTAQIWIPLFFFGFENHTLSLTIDITKIFIITMILSVVLGIIHSYYHAQNRLVWIEFVAFLGNSLMCLILLWQINEQIQSVAWLVLLKFLVQILVLIGGLGVPKSLRQDVWQSVSFFKKINPLVFSALYYKSGFLIDRILLSHATTGSITLFVFAQQIYAALNQFLVKVFVMPKLTELTILYDKKRYNQFRKKLHINYINLILICIIIFCFIFFFGKYSLSVLLMMNSQTADLSQLWLLLVILAGTLFGGVTGQLITNCFYASHDTTTVPKIAVLTYTVSIPLRVIGFLSFGINGLALATSLYTLVNMLILLFVFTKKILEWNNNRLVKTI